MPSMGPVRFNMESVQDNPPPGGYPKVSMKRIKVVRGPTGAMIWAGVIASTTYGFYWLGETNYEKRVLRKERRDARMAILPYLMAEQDELLQQTMDEAAAREKIIMKNVEGWKFGEEIYSKRWAYPTKGA